MRSNEIHHLNISFWLYFVQSILMLEWLKCNEIKFWTCHSMQERNERKNKTFHLFLFRLFFFFSFLIFFCRAHVNRLQRAVLGKNTTTRYISITWIWFHPHIRHEINMISCYINEDKNFTESISCESRICYFLGNDFFFVKMFIVSFMNDSQKKNANLTKAKARFTNQWNYPTKIWLRLYLLIDFLQLIVQFYQQTTAWSQHDQKFQHKSILILVKQINLRRKKHTHTQISLSKKIFIVFDQN